MELLTTEAGYLADLRALVSVYLDQLPTLTVPRPLLSPSYSSTFSLPTARRPSPPSSSSSYSHSDNSHHKPSKSHSKDALDPLLPSAELAIVARNAAQILAVHDALARMLLNAVRNAGWAPGISALTGEDPPDPPDDDQQNQIVEQAIAGVTAVFTSQAALFDAYESFCATHYNALDIVRRVQRRWPTEWDAYERRCADLATTLPASTNEPATPARRHSMSSLAPNPNHLPPRPGLTRMRSSRTLHPARLQLLDYLIKPVQRICKYPLLLAPLAPPGDAEQGGVAAMKRVAALVDTAHATHAAQQQAARILTRLEAPPSVREFVMSAGEVLLAGALDVVCEREGCVKAKYLGAFLFAGGFVLFVKATRGARYEARHWIEARGVHDREDEMLLPCSFRILSADSGPVIEVAASCRREKMVWVDALTQAVAAPRDWAPGSAPPPPPSSATFYSSPTSPTGPDPPTHALPTIQSIPEMEMQLPPVALVLAPPHPPTATSPRLKSSSATLAASPSRRSSSASVKAFFTPSPSASGSGDILVHRASAAARAETDRALADVCSAACSAARCYAAAHSEDLFHFSDGAAGGGSGFSTGSGGSGSGFASGKAPVGVVGSARNRLTKRESVLVRRRRSAVELAAAAAAEEAAFAATAAAGTAKAGERRRWGKALKLALDDVSNAPAPAPELLSPDSPTLVSTSQCSSSAASAVHSGPPKRARSMVDNVRGFFLAPPKSPARADVFGGEKQRARRGVLVKGTGGAGAGRGKVPPSASSPVLPRLAAHAPKRYTWHAAPVGPGVDADTDVKVVRVVKVGGEPPRNRLRALFAAFSRSQTALAA
ncbi:hypothetical protein BV25DRAFT_1605334 [Artomyces pyxidatus]|uniref:Uncharacterized protein n=1 Tax=Artomyces pyxidatus TaxID=48021 RepID=A0ACB8TCP9_9AGAM|nr:hypothetical protein BV25DRAFT_1605334 [Artomyces pyxidatus]